MKTVTGEDGILRQYEEARHTLCLGVEGYKLNKWILDKCNDKSLTALGYWKGHWVMMLTS